MVPGDGAGPIPEATGAHVAEDHAALDLPLTDGEVARIDGAERRERLVDPASAPWNRDV